MNMVCEMARDLMPLCLDDVASEESQKALENHLNQCEACQQQYEQMRSALPGQEKEREAQKQEQLLEMTGLVRQLRRFRVWRNVLVGILLGALVVVGAYLAWQGLMVNYNTEYPATEYDITLAQLSDGRVVAGIDYRGSHRNLALNIEAKDGDYRIYLNTPLIAQNMKSPNVNRPALVVRDTDSLQSISMGKAGDVLVWQKGNPIPRASSEMEAYFEVDAEFNRYWQQFDAMMADPDSTTSTLEASETLRQSLSRELERLRLLVPEWQ